MEREIRGGLLMLIVSAIAIASSVGAMYGLSRSGEGFSNIESNTQDVADDLRSVSLVYVGWKVSGCSQFFFSCS